MSDIALVASVDFTGAEAEVNRFVSNTKRKLATILADARRAGGSLSGGFGGGGGGGSRPAMSSSLTSALRSNALDAYKKEIAKIQELERAFGDGSIKWHNKVLQEKVAGLRRFGAMTEGNFRLRWALEAEDARKAAKNTATRLSAETAAAADSVNLMKATAETSKRIDKQTKDSLTANARRAATEAAKQADIEAAYATVAHREGLKRRLQENAAYRIQERADREAAAKTSAAVNAATRREISGFTAHVAREQALRVALAKDEASSGLNALRDAEAVKTRALNAATKTRSEIEASYTANRVANSAADRLRIAKDTAWETAEREAATKRANEIEDAWRKSDAARASADKRARKAQGEELSAELKAFTQAQTANQKALTAIQAREEGVRVALTKRTLKDQREALLASRKMMVGAAGSAVTGYYTPNTLLDVVNRNTMSSTGQQENLTAFYTRQAEAARARAEAEARKALEASRNLRMGAASGASGGYYRPSGVLDVIDRNTATTTGQRQSFSAFYAKQDADARAKADADARKADKLYTDYVREQEEKRTGTTKAGLKAAADAHKMVVDQRKREEASYTSWWLDQLKAREAAEKAANARSQPAARRADLNAVNGAEVAALGVRNRIGRQLGDDPALQTQLYTRLQNALTQYTAAITANGAKSLEAARASATWRKELTNIRSSIAENGGLLKTLNANTTSLRTGITQLGGSFGSFSRLAFNTQVVLSSLMAAFGFREITQSIQEFERFSATLNNVSGSVGAYQQNLAYLYTEANRIGFAVNEVGNSFARLAVSMTNAGFSGDQTRTMFTSLSEAARNFGLSSADTMGVIRALEQSMSKGTFQAEEVRLQLGDRLPVAMAALRAAMEKVDGKVVDVNKRFEEGTIDVQRYALEFVNQINRMSGGADTLGRTSNSLSANFARLSNEFALATQAFGDAGFTAGVISATTAIKDFLEAARGSGALDVLGGAFRSVAENIDLVIVALTALASTAIIGWIALFVSRMTPVGIVLTAVATAATTAAVAIGKAMRGPAEAAREFTTSFSAFSTIVQDLEGRLGTLQAVINRGGPAMDNTATATDRMVAAYMRLGNSAAEASRQVAQSELRMAQTRMGALETERNTLTTAYGERVSRISPISSFMTDFERQRQAAERFRYLNPSRPQAPVEQRVDAMSPVAAALAGVADRTLTIEDGIARITTAFNGQRIPASINEILTELAKLREDPAFAEMTRRLELANRQVEELQRRIGELRQQTADPITISLIAQNIQAQGFDTPRPNGGTGFTALVGGPSENGSPPVVGSAVTALNQASSARSALQIFRTQLGPVAAGNPAISAVLNDGSLTPGQTIQRLRGLQALRDLAPQVATALQRINVVEDDGVRSARGLSNAVAEVTEDLRLQADAAQRLADNGSYGAAAQAYEEANKRVADAASRAGRSINVVAQQEAARAEVTRRLNAELSLFVLQTNAQTASNARITAGYMESNEAGQRAEVVARAYNEALRFAAPEFNAAGEAAGAYLDKINELIPGLQDAERAERNRTAARQIDSNRDEIAIIELETRLVGANTNAIQQEVAALRARQAARGASPDVVDAAERSARQLTAARLNSEQLSNSWQDLARLGEQAFDRIGSAITEAFANGKISSISFAKIAKAMISEVIQAALRLAIINPMLNSVFGGTRGTAGGLFAVMNSPNFGGFNSGGVGGGLSASGLAAAGGSLAGIGAVAGSSGAEGSGLFGGIGSTLSSGWNSISSLFGGGASAAAPAAGALGNSTAFYGEGVAAFGTEAISAAPAGAAAGGIGSALGAIGGGFAVGSMLGSMIAGDNPNRQTNSMIGAGAGSLAGFAIGSMVGGPVVGALIGGALGGAGGGLLGPGKGFKGGDALIGFDDKGMLKVNGYAGKNFEQQAELMAQAKQQTDEVNAKLKALGLSFTGRSGEGEFAFALGGGESPNPTDIGDAMTAFNFGGKSLTSTNKNVMTAIGGDKSVTQAIEAADWVLGTFEPLTDTTGAYAQSIKALTKTFDDALEKTRELGLSEADLANARSKAMTEARDQRDAQLNAARFGVAARSLRADGGIYNNREADVLEYSARAQAEVLSYRKTLEDLSLSAEEVAADMGKLAEVQAKERAAIYEKYEADIRTWVNGTYNVLTKQTNSFALSLAALNEQFDAAGKIAKELGYSEAALNTARQEASAELYAARDSQILGLRQSLTVRNLRLDGTDASNQSADLMEFDLSAAQEKIAFKKTMFDLGMTSVEISAEMVRLEQTLGNERLSIIKKYSDAIAQTERENRETAQNDATSMLDNISDYIRGLRIGDASPLDAQAQYRLANSEFSTLSEKAAAGDANAMMKLTTYADTFIAASRNLNGSGTAYVQDFDRVIAALEQVADQGPDTLTASFLARTTETQTTTLVESLRAVKEEITALRREVRQQATTPERVS